MSKILTIFLIIISFFTAGDMTKANITPEKEIKAGDTSAVFMFENKTGKTLDLHIFVESVEMKKDGEWKGIPFEQMLDDVDFVYPSKLYPGEKTDLEVLFRQRDVYSEAVSMPVEEGSYRITVSFKTKGYRTVKEGKKTVEFTVMPA